MNYLKITVKSICPNHMLSQGDCTGHRILEGMVDEVAAPAELLVMVGVDELELAVVVDGLYYEVAREQARVHQA